MLIVCTYLHLFAMFVDSTRFGGFRCVPKKGNFVQSTLNIRIFVHPHIFKYFPVYFRQV